MALYWKLRHLIKGRDPLQNHAASCYSSFTKQRASLPTFIWSLLNLSALILFVFYPSLGSREFPSWAGRPSRPGKYLIRNSTQWASTQPLCVLLPTLPSSQKKRWQCVKTWCVECVGSGARPWLLGSGNKLSAPSVIVMIRVEPSSDPHGVDTEMPRAPNMSPCSPEHGNNSGILHVCYKVFASSVNPHQPEYIHSINLWGFMGAFVTLMNKSR